MGLIALLAACRETDDEVPRLCASMPVGGRSLLEYQAYLARDGGAEGFVVYAERVSTELRQAIERLQQAGFRVKLAQSVMEMIDHIHPTDRLLVIADGMVVSGDIISRLVDYPGEVIGTLGDLPAHAGFERLDANARWAGIALVDGSRVAAIRSMPEDWDVQSTLLRSAVQIGTSQLGVDDLITTKGGAVLYQVEGEAGLAEIDQRLLNRQQAVPGKGDWIERQVYAPIGRLLGPNLLRYGIAGTWFAVGAMLLHCLSISLFFDGSRTLGVISLMLAGPIYALGAMLGTIRGERNFAYQHHVTIRQILDIAIILALAWGLYREGAGWGQLALAFVVVQHGLYLTYFARWTASESGWRVYWQPGGDVMAWLLLLCGIMALWQWVLGVLAIWLSAVFVDRMRRIAQRH
ncbi:hypothetical protein [Aquisediminimonas sediminicola]|uniref:hypothetical protein n=1 Tax=Alteraquisediminimonas sediminicola TaxID=2676787 RepID=UPI001C8E940C|nr:hypothetical protein [Aquisediminimonas sediminicola]